MNYAARVLGSSAAGGHTYSRSVRWTKILITRNSFTRPGRVIKYAWPDRRHDSASRDVRRAWDLLISHRSTTVLLFYDFVIAEKKIFRFLLANLNDGSTSVLYLFYVIEYDIVALVIKYYKINASMRYDLDSTASTCIYLYNIFH